jgi:hypothetical protein
MSEKINSRVLAIRGMIVINIAFLLISCTRWFGGSESTVGVAEQLFGHMRFGGFRIDFVWCFLSTAVVLFAGVVFAIKARTDKDASISACVCLAEVAVFCFYIVHTFTSGVLDFG